MNSSDLDLYSCLRYTPYDNKVASIFKHGVNEEEGFFNHLFVKYNDDFSRTIIKQLDDYIEDKERRFLYFIGSAGTGKTTFLHYYVRNSLMANKNFAFNFINLIAKPSESYDEDAIKRNICASIDDVLAELKIDNIINAYVKYGKDIPFFNNEEGRVGDRIFFNFLYKKRRDNSSDSAEISLLPYYSIKQLVAILVILFTYKNNTGNGLKKQNITIFDNIDELSQTYIAKKYNSIIYDVFSYCQDYFDKVDTTLFKDSHFINHTTFITSIRSVNAKVIGESQQMKERVRFQKDNIEFNPYVVNYSKMIKKRMDYFSNNHQSDDQSVKMLVLRQYSQAILNSKSYVNRIIDPLLNYDRRMLTFSFKSISENIATVEGMSKVSSEIGVHGAILLNTLIFLYKENNNSSLFTSYVQHDIQSASKDGEKKCNILRMCFTLLSNLSGLSNISKSNRTNLLKREVDFYYQLKSVAINDFYNRIKIWFTAEEIRGALLSLVSTSSSNYEIPTFLEGVNIDQMTDSFYQKDEKDISNSTYAQYMVSNVLRMSEEERQRNKIRINPLCVVYPYHVFIHFEYFHILSYYNPSISSRDEFPLRPLFLIKDKKELENCLSSVRIMYEAIVKSIQVHFCQDCEEHCEEVCLNKKRCKEKIKRFKEDQFCFNGALYSTRAFTAIINYIDEYRIYSWNLTIDREIQEIIINEMEKFFDYFKTKRVQDDSARLKIHEMLNNLRTMEAIGDYRMSVMPKTDVFGVS